MKMKRCCCFRRLNGRLLADSSSDPSLVLGGTVEQESYFAGTAIRSTCCGTITEYRIPLISSYKSPAVRQQVSGTRKKDDVERSLLHPINDALTPA
jgi:hypothetical protein